MVVTGSFADSTLSVRFDEKKWYSRDFWKLKILLGFWNLISWHFDSCKARVSRSKLLVRRSVLSHKLVTCNFGLNFSFYSVDSIWDRINGISPHANL